MLYLDSESKKDMNIYINCSGGEVVPCLAIHDTMRHIKSDVGTVGFGGCMGMSGFLLAVGKKVGGWVAWGSWLFGGAMRSGRFGAAAYRRRRRARMF